LNEMYGTLKSGAPQKKGYHLLRAQMENADIARIINSTEVQSVLRPKLEAPRKVALKQNALRNRQVMEKLNPAFAEAKALRTQAATAEKRKACEAASKEHNKKHKRGEETFYKKLMKAFEAKAKEEDTTGEGGEEDEE